MNDPYPEDLGAIDAPPLDTIPVVDPVVVALNRIAVAIERLASHPQPVQNGPQATLTALPPVQATQAPANGVCPIHGTPWKVVPAGVSKKTGKPYDAFKACSTSGCDQRPPR